VKKLLLSLLLAPSLWAQTPENLKFPGPDSAPVYVIEGNFSQNYWVGGLNFDVDWSVMMDPASGAVAGTGFFSINGTFYYYGSNWPINFDGAVQVDLTAKPAGSVLRVNGKMALAGTGSIAGYYVDRCLVNYNYSNFEVNPATATMSGYMSAKGTARVPGYATVPVNVPAQFVSWNLPDENTNGAWDSAGDWTAEIDANVNGKGKISGTGELAVVDETGEAYDLIPQTVSGSVKNGTVSLASKGSTSSTSRIKVNLTYLQATDETVPQKSAVSAYGQNRKF